MDEGAYEQDTEIVVPGADAIRKVWYQERWFYSVVDIIAFLTGSRKPRRYWSDLKRRVATEGFTQVYAECVQLKMSAPDGKSYLTDAADRETLFRIIQSIPSPKAEGIKIWLAASGEQRLQEAENPELSIEKARETYRLQGYTEEWIEKRVQSILVRNELTQEWDERGAEKKDYGPLTNTIAKGTFGLGVQDHLVVKGLKRGNLRDHMTSMELILSMLGEATTTELHRERDSRGVPCLQQDAKDGGALAGRTRKDLEQQLGSSIVSPTRHIPPQKKRVLKRSEKRQS